MRALLCVVLLLVVVPGSAEAGIKTLSTRPDMVTGGDVLVRVDRDATVRVNGRVVSGRGETRLLDGLALGRNTITADRDRLTVINHPITGPVFSGPHEQPFVCETETAGLGAPLDSDCSVATHHETRPDGVRFETGTINRGIYEIAVPADWNRRLIYNFGGGCTDGWYRQGPGTGGVLDAFMLSHGYAVASSSLNVFGNNCQEVTAAETMMMVKEHFIEAYGVPASTMGFGCCGGSYQQHQIADNYPGLLDGIMPGCSFPEVTQATVSFITDAWLLDHYFTQSADWYRRAEAGGHRLRQLRDEHRTSRRAPAGSTRACSAASCPPTSATTRSPTRTARAATSTTTRSTSGVAIPTTGFARRPLDNVGIQYGLRALSRARSRRTSSSISTSASAASTPTRTSSRSARSPTPSRCAARIAPAASPTAASASGTPDHRLPRLQRRRGQRRYPCPLPLVLDARTTAQGQRHGAQPGHARRGPALRALQHRVAAPAARDPRARPLAHHRLQAAGGLHDARREPDVHRRAPDARPEHALRAAVPERVVPARGRRRGRGRRHRQVRPEADRPRGLPRPAQRDAARPAAGDLPDRRVRLDPPGVGQQPPQGTWLSFGPP